MFYSAHYQMEKSVTNSLKYVTLTIYLVEVISDNHWYSSFSTKKHTSLQFSGTFGKRHLFPWRPLCDGSLGCQSALAALMYGILNNMIKYTHGRAPDSRSLTQRSGTNAGTDGCFQLTKPRGRSKIEEVSPVLCVCIKVWGRHKVGDPVTDMQLARFGVDV